MESTAEEPQKFQSGSQLLLTPLMISMAGIACTALALVLYNFIVTKLWIRRNNNTTSGADVILQQPIQENQAEKKVLESIPIFAFSRLKLKQEEEEGLFHVDEQSECAVCLGALEEDEMVRLLPSCGHAFHVQCIDQWVVRSHHSNCPVCRSAIVAGSAMVEEKEEEVLVMEIREIEEEEEEGGGGDQSDRARHSCDELRVVLPIVDDGLKSHVPGKIGRDREEHATVRSSSSSSSSSTSSSFSDGSFERLDCASMALMKSLSRLRSGHNRISDGLLPR